MIQKIAVLPGNSSVLGSFFSIDPLPGEVYPFIPPFFASRPAAEPPSGAPSQWFATGATGHRTGSSDRYRWPDALEATWG
jgi:hypothetical protein